MSSELEFKSHEAKSTLLELYSSEGCSSCPPAEAWISKLKSSPGLWTELFPIVFHVDYWDGLGWPDRFARPAYTQRQRSYAESLSQASVYTPEFIASGHEWRGWFQGDKLPSARIATRGELTLLLDVDAKSFSSSYFPPPQTDTRTYTLNVAFLGFDLATDVKRGENGGRQLQHDFVVLDFFSKPMTLDKMQKYQSGIQNFTPSSSDNPGAIVAWITGADGSLVQIVGGWLKPVAY